MNKNKVIFSSVVFMVVFSILYWYQELLGLKEANMVEQAIISNCDFQLSFLVALLSAALFLVLTYHKKEIDPNVLREEFVRSKFSNRETEIFEELSVEKQQGILKYYQNHFKREDWNDCDRYIVNHLSIPRWRSHPIHENRVTKSIWTEPCNPLLRATKSTKRATSA